MTWTPDGLSDELLERLRRRDETVFPALVNRHGPRLAATVAATWRGVPDHDAEEIVADVVAPGFRRWISREYLWARIRGWDRATLRPRR